MSGLVNGSPTTEFSPKLRQSDPISPLLFNLVAEVLSSMINRAVQELSFKGIQLSGAKNIVTHVQFADDTSLFINNYVDSIKAIRHVLSCFQLLSGFKINFLKSKLFSVGYCKSIHLRL